MSAKVTFIRGGITAPKGFLASGHYCGIKKSGKKDLALVYSEILCNAAGVFTTNKVQASCVAITKRRVAGGKAQAIVVNSGNANCLTGRGGFADTVAVAREAAKLLKLRDTHVCVASTGIIGRRLPVKKIVSAMPQLVRALNRKGAKAAAEAIMTTDHIAKEAAIKTRIGGKTVRIGAMTKGGGMIHPNMATMLCFVTTDATAAPTVLRAALKDAVDKTFNMMTVDGDMSTNDMVLLLGNGLSKSKAIAEGSKDFRNFREALEVLFLKLAKMMLRDAEGATKFVEITVRNAATAADARKVARAIASSNLVKTALFGGDPNWGRIAAAAGYSGAEIDQWRMKIYLGDVLVLRNGGIVPNRTSRKNPFAVKDIVITVDLGLGKERATAYACDLSTDYVIFNSAYKT